MYACRMLFEAKKLYRARNVSYTLTRPTHSVALSPACGLQDALPVVSRYDLTAPTR